MSLPIIYLERVPLFGCVSRGELVLRGPTCLDPIAPPHPGRPDSCAAWLLEGLSPLRPSPKRPALADYHEAIIFVPITATFAEDWNQALRQAGFVRLPDARHKELTDDGWPRVLGFHTSVEHADAWLLERKALTGKPAV